MDASSNTSTLKRTIWKKYSHFWSFKDIEQLSKPKNVSDYRELEKFTSKDKKITLTIRFYPDGLNEKYKDFVSLQLFLFTQQPKELYKTSVAILNSNSQIIKSVLFRETYSKEQTVCGFMKKEDLRSSVGVEKLSIYLEVCLKIADIEDEREENFVFDPPLEELQLALNFGKLLDDGKYSDIVVVCSDGEKINAHKLVLAMRSPVFAGMLEKKTSKIDISDCKSEVVQLLLRFIYFSKIDVPNFQVAIELLNVAEEYKIPDLKWICIKYLDDHLDTSNACTAILLSCKDFAKELKGPVNNFIVQNFDKFSRDEIQNLATNIPQQIFGDLMYEVSKRLRYK